MTPRDITCELVDLHADELALGSLDEPLRSRLLGHASQCADCRTLVDGLSSVADRLLAVAPEVEPPAGFESRVLASLGGPPTRVQRSRWWSLVAAVALLAVVGLTAAIVRSNGDSPMGATPIVAPDGTEVGAVRLVRDETPHLLVTIDHPRPGTGTRHCELQVGDGSWVEVGTWEPVDVARGVWAVGIDPGLLDATAMRIRTDDGTVLASATW